MTEHERRFETQPEPTPKSPSGHDPLLVESIRLRGEAGLTKEDLAADSFLELIDLYVSYLYQVTKFGRANPDRAASIAVLARKRIQAVWHKGFEADPSKSPSLDTLRRAAVRRREQAEFLLDVVERLHARRSPLE